MNQASLQRVSFSAIAGFLLLGASFASPMASEAASRMPASDSTGGTTAIAEPLGSGRLTPWAEPVLVARRFRYRPPNLGAPRRREGASVRAGRTCVPDQDKAIALLPDVGRVQTVGQPTFFAYVPATPAQKAEFILRDSITNRSVYRTPVNISSNPGIVSVTLPPERTLELNRNYQWRLAIICNEEDRSGDVVVEGIVVRIKPSDAMLQEIQKAKPAEVPAIYAEAGVWYDAIATVAKMRRSEPNNPDVIASWTDLLTSIGLERFAKQPLMAEKTTTGGL